MLELVIRDFRETHIRKKAELEEYIRSLQETVVALDEAILKCDSALLGIASMSATPPPASVETTEHVNVDVAGDAPVTVDEPVTLEDEEVPPIDFEVVRRDAHAAIKDFIGSVAGHVWFTPEDIYTELLKIKTYHQTEVVKCARHCMGTYLRNYFKSGKLERRGVPVSEGGNGYQWKAVAHVANGLLQPTVV